MMYFGTQQVIFETGLVGQDTDLFWKQYILKFKDEYFYRYLYRKMHYLEFKTILSDLDTWMVPVVKTFVYK